MGESRAAIGIERVSKRFGSVGAVDDVSIEIDGKLKRPYDFPEARSTASLGR